MFHHQVLRYVGSACLACSCLMPAGGVSGGEVQLPKGLVLTKPVTPDNVVADMRAINEELARGVKPEENAVVWLLQGVGPKCLGIELHDPTLEMLGIEKLSAEGPVLEDLEEFGRRREKAGSNYAKEAKEFGDGILVGPTRMWSREEFGALAIYLDESAGALALIAEGTRQPHYYWPLLSDVTPQRIISASYSLELRLQFVGKLLGCRAHLRMSEGKIEEALEDVSTLHRLAVMMSYGSPFDVTVAKANQIDSFAYIAEKNLLESGKLTGEIAKKHMNELSGMKPIAPSDWIADRGERAIVLQEIALTRLEPEDLKSMFTDPDEEEETEGAKKVKPPKPVPKIDWKAARERGDEIQSRLVEVLATRDSVRQMKMFDELDAEYAGWEKNLDDTTRKVVKALNEKNDIAGASRYLGESMARALKTHYRQRKLTDDRSATRRNLVVTGLGLIAYQREKGEFPESLAVLSPDYLSSVPSDAHTGKPFDYVRETKDSARITSWGTNRTDDAGKVPNDDQIIKLK